MPSAEEMEKSGFTAADFASDPVEAWPENEPAFNLFKSVGTQWRIGPNGPFGLDYNVLYRKMDRMGLGTDECDALEHDIRVMECAALQCMRKA